MDDAMKKILFNVNVGLILLTCCLTSCSARDYSQYSYVPYQRNFDKDFNIYCWQYHSAWESGIEASPSNSININKIKWMQYELPCPIYKMKEIIHEYANLDNLDYVHVIIVSYPATYQDIENAYEYDLSKKETYVYLFNQLDLPVPDKLK